MKKINLFILLLATMFSLASMAEVSDSFKASLKSVKSSKGFLERSMKVKKSYDKAKAHYLKLKDSNSPSAKTWLKIAKKRSKWLVKYKSFWNKFYKSKFNNMEYDKALSTFVMLQVVEGDEITQAIAQSGVIESAETSSADAADGDEETYVPVSSGMGIRNPQRSIPTASGTMRASKLRIQTPGLRSAVQGL